jgi:hypothetical protein
MRSTFRDNIIGIIIIVAIQFAFADSSNIISVESDSSTLIEIKQASKWDSSAVLVGNPFRINIMNIHNIVDMDRKTDSDSILLALPIDGSGQLIIVYDKVIMTKKKDQMLACHILNSPMDKFIVAVYDTNISFHVGIPRKGDFRMAFLPNGIHYLLKMKHKETKCGTKP